MQDYLKYKHNIIKMRLSVRMTNKKDCKKKEYEFEIVMKTFKYFYKIAWDYKPLYFMIIVLSILFQAIAPFINIIVPKCIIDEMQGERDIHKFIIYVAIIAIGNSIFILMNKFFTETRNIYGDSFERYFSMQISKKAMTMAFEYTEDPQMLNLCQRAEKGVGWCSGGIAGLTECFVTIVASILTLSGVTVLITRGGSTLLLIIAINVLSSTYFNTKENTIELKYFERFVSLNRAFKYYTWNLPSFQFGNDIRLYHAENMVIAKGEENNRKVTSERRNQANESVKYQEGNMLVTGTCQIISNLYIGVKTLRGFISIGDFSMLITATTTLADSLNNIIFNIQNLYKKVIYMQDYMKFMDYKDIHLRGKKKLVINKNKKYIIEFKNVGFTYPRTIKCILKNISITLNAGEHLSIVGLNGAGKTTFIKLLCRLYEVTEGEILLNGININEYDYNDYIKLISVVFQDFRLMAFSIRDNIGIEDESASDEKIMTLCELSGLSEKVNSLQKGLNTSIYKLFDEDGIVPSGGEKQKLAIARALYKNAPIVVLDEPTAALDPKAEYEIYNHFKALVRNKTAIYISHRLSSCKFCDKIAVFSEGTIKEYGTHEQLIKLSGGIYAKMFAAQAQYYT